MRRLAPLLGAALLFAPGCRIHKKDRPQPAEANGPVSVINVADPRAAAQLAKGFYDVENGSWRWTAKSFTVSLKPPANASKKGAVLQLKFTIPEVMFSRVGAMTLDARINGLDLGAQTFSEAGDCTYTRDVPGAALLGDTVPVDFHVDKGLPPGEQDPRELAVIVTTVGLLPK